MASERLFADHHLPEGMRIATNSGETLGDFSEAMSAAYLQSVLASEALSSRILPSSYIADRDTPRIKIHTEPMNDMTREELSSTLSAIEERMDKRIDRMEYDAEKRVLDYKSELALRDEQVRREVDLRQESFRFEQAARDAALSEKFSGFLAAQAERDKAWEKISEARFDRIEKDVSSIKTDTKKVSDDVNGIKVTMAKYLGAAVVIGALASAALGAAAKHLLG